MKKNCLSLKFLLFSMTLMTFLISGCGSPKTNIKVRNNAEGTATDISVQQGEGGSTSVTVSPSSKISLDSVKFHVEKK